MASPDPDSITFVGKLMAGIAGVVAPVWGANKYLNARLDKKADKEEFDRQRDNIVKLFDRIDKHQAQDSEMHQAMLGKIHDMHVNLIDRIDRLREDR